MTKDFILNTSFTLDVPEMGLDGPGSTARYFILRRFRVDKWLSGLVLQADLNSLLGYREELLYIV